MIPVSSHTNLNLLMISTLICRTTTVALVFSVQFAARSQGFDSGSNAQAPDFILPATRGTTNIVLPPDGILRFGTVNITANWTVTFTPNPLNTPVYLLAHGDVTLDGKILLVGHGDGSPGPGGFAGGSPGGGTGRKGGRGHGPGGGAGSFAGTRAGSAKFTTSRRTSANALDGTSYGSSVLMPLIGGSGGGGGGGVNDVGSGGGGAILIASNTRIILGRLGEIDATTSSGPNSMGGLGSAGAVRLVAPEIDNSASTVNSVFVPGTSVGHPGRARADLSNMAHFLPGNLLRNSLLVAPDTVSVGNLLAVFPPPAVAPSLDVIQVGPTTISPGFGARVNVTIPAGLPAAQPIVVRARNLDGANLKAILIPQFGDPIEVTGIVNGNSADVRLTANFPLNTLVSVEVWTE